MADIGGIRIDESLADILSRLKQSNSKSASADKKSTSDLASHVDTGDTGAKSLVDRFSSQVKLNTSDFQSFTRSDYKAIESANFTEEDILPWLSYSDKDNDNIHYINSEYTLVSTSAKKTPSEIASLRMSKDFLCECDYFKSRHHVLYVRQLDSDYSYSRSFIAANESVKDKIIVEDTQIIDKSDNLLTLQKVSTENLTGLVIDSYKYFHFVVFTDLGIADFIAKSDDISYPYSHSVSDIDGWFESISNTVSVKNAKFDSNKKYELSNEVDSIRDYSYNIISMRRPGVFTLDSDENQDPDYKVIIKIKDEFSFIPTNSIILCLKKYSSSSHKSIDVLKRFLNRYFDVTVQ